MFPYVANSGCMMQGMMFAGHHMIFKAATSCWLEEEGPYCCLSDLRLHTLRGLAFISMHNLTSAIPNAINANQASIPHVTLASSQAELCSAALLEFSTAAARWPPTSDPIAARCMRTCHNQQIRPRPERRSMYCQHALRLRLELKLGQPIL